VEVLWRVEGPERVHVALVWREYGGAAHLPTELRKGFGFELLEKTLPYELEGTSAVALAPTGLVCSVTFPTEPDELLGRRERS
jgi:two-component system CheB/CheR fusion protein